MFHLTQGSRYRYTTPSIFLSDTKLRVVFTFLLFCWQKFKVLFERMNASSFRHSPSFPLHLQACLDVAVPSKKNKRRSDVEVKERREGEREQDLEVFHLLHNAFAQILLLCNFFFQLNSARKGNEGKERRRCQFQLYMCRHNHSKTYIQVHP